MTLALCESTKNEGYSPGLRVIEGSMPNQSILLNATYNNYTITNHYRSKEQIEANCDLERQLDVMNKKYQATKQLLWTAAQLVNHVPIETLDAETRTHLIKFKIKCRNLRPKRKAEQEEDIKTQSVKKAKTSIK